jgi:hypothetical protein
MDRDELLALIGRHPKMDAGSVPAEWVQVAEANYSMHGHGLLRNILAGVAPVIEAAERRRVVTELMKRHEPVPGDWGYSCGTCWVKGGSRATWPCSESRALAALLMDEAADG